MTTKVYGCSDDLVEIEGELSGEVGCYGTDDDEDLGVLIAFDDATVLAVKYGKNNDAIWGIRVLNKGEMFERIEHCDNSEADPYSDVVWFKDGPLKAWSGKNAEIVR
jgi:hypothetical protein